MADIDNDTLMVSLQAVFESVNRFEALLESHNYRTTTLVQTQRGDAGLVGFARAGYADDRTGLSTPYPIEA